VPPMRPRESRNGHDLASEKPLVLVLEDLHWSDPATIDALASLARRAATARLLVIGEMGGGAKAGRGVPSFALPLADEIQGG
jgi:AAA ATPase domain